MLSALYSILNTQYSILNTQYSEDTFYHLVTSGQKWQKSKLVQSPPSVTFWVRSWMSVLIHGCHTHGKTQTDSGCGYRRNTHIYHPHHLCYSVDSMSDRPVSYDTYTKPDTRRRKAWIVRTVLNHYCTLCWPALTHQAFSAFIVLLIIAAIVGVAVGVPLSRKNNNNNISTNSGSSSDSKGNGSGNNNNNNKPPHTNAGTDPSVFPKDPNLHQAFYGIAYTPEGSQLPDCGNSLG